MKGKNFGGRVCPLDTMTEHTNISRKPFTDAFSFEILATKVDSRQNYTQKSGFLISQKTFQSFLKLT